MRGAAGVESPEQGRGSHRRSAARLPALIAVALVAARGAAGPVSLHDPEYLISNWQTVHGLPENSATSMVQTADGYLWFGTFHGLVRFDGLRFRVFNLRNTPELPNLGVVNLHLDRAGGLWVSTLGGLAYHHQGRWRRFGPEQGWTGDYVRHFAETPDGTIYLRTFDRRTFRYARGRFDELPAAPGRNDVQYLFPDPAGRLQSAGLDYLSAWTGAGWDSVEAPPEVRAAAANLIYGAASDGQVWAASGRTLWKLDGGRVVKRLTLEMELKQPWSLTEDANGQIWVCSYLSGLYRISPNGRVRWFGAASGLPSNSIRFVFTDRQRNRWVGTSGGGLVRLRERRFFGIGAAEGLPDYPVKSVAAEREGSMLFATYGGGVYRFNGAKVFRLPGARSSNIFAQTILVDRRGRIWIGAIGNELVLHDRGTSVLLRRATDDGTESVESLFEDSQGWVWIAWNRGVTRSDGVPLVPYERRGSATGVPIRCFAEDPRSGQIWAGGDAGLLRLEGSTFVPVKDAAGKELPPVTFIHPSGRGTLWLGTTVEGLLHWDRGKVSEVGSDRAPLGTVGGILEEREHLWLATNRGVWRFRTLDLERAVRGEKVDLEWQQFDAADGMPSAECTWDHQPSVGRDNAGRLWFSTLRGAALIDPGRMTLDTTEAKVRFEELGYLAADDQERTLSPPALAPGRVSLPAGSRNIRVGFAALEFSNAERVLFSYELRQDGNLAAAGQRQERELYFPRLDAGDYLLTVKARNADGIWGATPSQLHLRLEPFLWERRSFLAAVWLLLAGSVTWVAVGLSRMHSRRVMAALARDKESAELRARLVQAGKMESIGRLAGGVAHDFNNLLTVINGYSDLLLARLRPDDANLESLRQIRRAGGRAADLVHQLLTFSRKQRTQPRICEINVLVRETQAMMRRLLREDVELRVALGPAPGWIFADPAQIEQILLNLVVNGRDAMAEGGTLRIETGAEEVAEARDGLRPGRYVTLTVRDSGAGMSEDVQRRIFEPFFTTKEVGKGTGLGLAIVYGVVEQAQGQIVVASQPGKGTTFTVYFPRQETAPTPEGSEAQEARAGSETVLVAEDEEDVLKLTADSLRSCGYRVLAASNGSDALAAARSHHGRLDLLLTDVVMPGMNGVDLARAIVAERPATKILYMSGYADDVALYKGVAQQDLQLLPKPFGSQALAAKVREVLDGE